MRENTLMHTRKKPPLTHNRAREGKNVPGSDPFQYTFETSNLLSLQS